jgi:tetrapyrrole methylase family protein/MazG family protein
LLDAIDSQPDGIQEELGDVLLQIMLHSQIAADEERFSITDVINTINNKMIERHPHVFGDETRENAEAVAENWEKKKQADSRGLLDGLPKGLPALQKAHLIGARTERVGFDWDNPESAAEKVKEEVDEYLEAVRENHSQSDIEEELGDLLFSIAQLSRKQSLNSEEVLQRANNKFIARFQHMEQEAKSPLAELTASELQNLWENAKTALK